MFDLKKSASAKCALRWRGRGRDRMQTILIIGLTMAGTGLAGPSGASAPVNATVNGDLATVTPQGTPVQRDHWY
jgi:hypothetical protein